MPIIQASRENDNVTLEVGQHTLNQRLIGIVNQLRTAQVTLTLARLLGQDVATERLLVLEAVSCLLEALRSAAIALDFRHESNSARVF